MHKVRNGILSRLLWVMLSLYFLNISVDVNDVSDSVAEDTSYNKQESLIEIIVEKALGYEKAFAEADEQDGDQNAPAKKSFSVDYFISPTAITWVNNTLLFTAKQKLIAADTRVTPPAFEIHSPPPEMFVFIV